MGERTYKLEGLARAAGVSPRTVRYYIQRGLLPPPVFRGPDTVYELTHLQRLRAVRRLQQAYWPLDAIRGLLDAAGERRIARIAEGEEVPPPPGEEGWATEQPAQPIPRQTTATGRGRATRHARGAERAVVRPSERVVRITVAQGLVLEVSEDAPATVRALADRLVDLAGRFDEDE
ncbi:MAG: MerR family transcriptional regulator [Myxococcota bacterium]|nr:MerR family transcriptional regulator [Myxococcota bacterium]MDW8361806.1 MerR family transcriptional regulator [Myxococcales bacterium]